MIAFQFESELIFSSVWTHTQQRNNNPRKPHFLFFGPAVIIIQKRTFALLSIWMLSIYTQFNTSAFVGLATRTISVRLSDFLYENLHKISKKEIPMCFGQHAIEGAAISFQSQRR